MDENALLPETAQAVLDIIAPGSTLTSIVLADGSFSNYTHIVTATLKDDSPYKVVVRRYKVFGEYDRGEKARREFNTIRLLNRHHVVAPEAIYLDDAGTVLGIPGIVTRFVEGSLMMDLPNNPLDWARKLAHTLAKIHSIPCSRNEQRFLLNGNSEALWFLNHDSPPKYMQEYPGGADVWYILKKLHRKFQPDAPALMHIDYWSGNILWHENEIAAVIDWEEAAYGDPGYDAGYARMNMILMGLPDAADEFISDYETHTGHALKNLVFWELAASVRPMTDPVGWKVDQPPGMNVLQNFIEEAKGKLQRQSLMRRGF